VTAGARLPVRVGVSLDPFDAQSADGSHLWAAVALMEELGIDSLWLPDSATLGGLAPLPALAAVAARTSRLKLGTSVLVMPPRNPVLLAGELATIDVLSNGRLLPAGGLGVDRPAELAALGIPREERADRLEESVAIIKALWPGEPVSYHGRHWSLTDVQLRPRPVRPKLEFWLGGKAPAALRRIGRIADGWLTSGVAPEEFRAKADVIRAAAAEAGRTIDADHYGATVFASPREEELPAAVRGLRAAGHQIAVGTDELRDLLERFAAEGASKFVVIPSAGDPLAWLRELHVEVIAPLEASTG
jgi:probable F420-dependent oxidoreductase